MLNQNINSIGDFLPYELLPEKACMIFRHMIRSRILETKLSSLYKAGKIVGGVYLGKGQEAVSASLGASLSMGKDIFAPLIRDQAGRMAFGEAIIDTTRTYLGSVEGPMRGRDGNIHRGRPQQGMLAMISHLGAQLSMVAGGLMAKRMKGSLAGAVGATCIGDGATSTGSFHEGLNLVAVEKLPLVVVIANNQFAYSTPNSSQFACEHLIDRAIGYGMQGHSCDGTDFLQTAKTIGEAVARARAGEGPQLIEAKLLRLSGHGEHDDASYVPEVLKSSSCGRDCIEIAKQQLLENQWLTEEQILIYEEEARAEIQHAVAQTQQEAKPNPFSELWSAISNPQHREL